MVTFKKVLIALAVMALFIGLSSTADGQTLKATVSKPMPPLHSLIAEPRPSLSVELDGKKVQLVRREYQYTIDKITYRSVVFYKPGTDEDWLHYESADEVVGKETDGRSRIFHQATIITVRKSGLHREPRWELVEEYQGNSIDQSKEKFFKALEKKFKLVMPPDIEL